MLVKLCPFFKAEEEEVREKRRVDSRDVLSNEKTRAVKPRRKEKEGRVTELIKLRVDSRRAGHRTHQPGFEEGGPTVDQTPLTTYVILREDRVEDEETKRGRRGSTKRRKNTHNVIQSFSQIINIKIQTIIKCCT